MAKSFEFIVVGGGLAGLMATVRLAEAGHKVKLLALHPVKRSHSVCAQGGINGAVNTKGEGDSTWEHFDDTIYGGDFLADQPPVKGMCEAAPGIIYLLDRMGVMFNRTAEGLIDFRRFGGTKHHRTAYAGATTGKQILYALDEQVRRAEMDGLVEKLEFWDFLSAVLDGQGRCIGIVAQDLRSMEVRSFAADAVVLATGGIGMVYGRSTNSMACTGAAVAAVYQQGAKLGNPEFVQVHPTAIPGDDKLRLMSESARGEGGRVWVPRDGKPWYFLEEWYPAYGNLVPRDIATRAIFKVCVEMGLGIDGRHAVYLDLTHKDPHELDVKLGGILEIYEKYRGVDPRKVPMQVFPGVHYTMGGLWTDFDLMSNIPGLFGAGEAQFHYHGANRLGANSLLSCIYDGQVSATSMVAYAQGATKGGDRYLDEERKRQAAEVDAIFKMQGSENPYALWRELGDLMTRNVTVVRHNEQLDKAFAKLSGDLLPRWSKLNVLDTGRWANQAMPFVRQLRHMLVYAQAITKGALLRNESRGAHYKPAFTQRDDAKFLKTTIAAYTPKGPEITYAPVDTSLIPPRARTYDVDKKAGPEEKGKKAAAGGTA
jgi:succinate dehydrogenase / fumarate reductase flavoprotein subunit